MTPDELKQALIAAGWRISEQRFRDLGCNWYAWLPREQRAMLSDCACNDKPPSFTIEPASIEIHDKIHSSVTFRLCGELPNGRWVDLQAYKEIKEDEHPIIVVSAADIADLLRRNGKGSAGVVAAWLAEEFPKAS